MRGVRFVPMDPPGSMCQWAALLDRLGRKGRGRTVIDVGCGNGSLLVVLCRTGFRAIGVDSSKEALAVARRRLEAEIASGRCELHHAASDQLRPWSGRADVAISMMTMEHIVDDAGFLRALVGLVRPGGDVLVGVPGRQDRWGFEDEVVGHIRRYERPQLAERLLAAGLEEVDVWSVSVPVANILFRASQALVKRTAPASLLAASPAEQTSASGIQEIPFKTVFPSPFRWLLNERTLAPVFWLQRRFYHSDLGLTLLGSGRVPAVRGSLARE